MKSKTPINYERCAFIVRGRGQQLTDQLLPEFCRIVSQITPNEEKDFNKKVREELFAIIPGGAIEKTADNYRTEILGKLLGLYYVDESGKVFLSERGRRLHCSNDNIQFFKDLCCRLQVPSAMSKNAQQFADKGIQFWPASSLITIMREAESIGCRSLTKKEINYFIFSNLDVLTSSQGPKITANIIKSWRTAQEEAPIGGSSREAQHSNEVLNLLANANLIKFKEDEVFLNHEEDDDAERIIIYQNKANYFKVGSYNLASQRKHFEVDWDFHYSKPCFEDAAIFATKGKMWPEMQAELDDEETLALVEEPLAPKIPLRPTATISREVASAEKSSQNGQSRDGDDTSPIRLSTKLTGEMGEQYVWMKEKLLIKARMPNEAGRVLRLGHQRGLGFDVQSVFAEPNNYDNFKYIEVKSSRCVTKPLPNQKRTFTLTENEYKAARQHKSNFYVFKVFLLPGEEDPVIYALCDPLGAADLNSEKVRVEKKESQGTTLYDFFVSPDQCTQIEYAS